ncbi:uncharacterized protein L3040_000974 [Drepanopeziza brunnea f. sp. 'multigermtubi']|uniref:Uncharacterized protein n=1 Tax=Marssonina brunnea f. sp. multigermtubi (strain MB_m1) TaxID=1072389 RepID=K1X6Z2_MARBU|nr:uncharacterized protein MBM_01554 [Drepanopeziza brunnea f. sp. 'multigermtubi' MB_m1]EKD20872.1 hypothetical protein MBM_01554 [Drepanopeziza brunnea f. sp. 'multigermtubi' MB_m1]KAJ5054708.1 hypothetical protein L3040_000974 [Drepanopeziza brunnea f. sp. 'multigermtubi']
MLQSKSIFAILLALSLLFSEAHGFWWNMKVIGYARVPPGTASLINADNKVHIEERPDYDILGRGFYLGQEPSYSHLGEGEEGFWYCAIKARDWNMKNINKVFVPERYWIGGLFKEVNLEAYLKWLTNKKPEKQLRFTFIERSDTQMQMLIPISMINNDDLDLWAQCYESEQQLRDSSKHFKDFIKWSSKWFF